MNKQFGYETPADLYDKYPQILLDQCFSAHSGRNPLPEPHLKRRQWIAGLYSNVFRAERDLHGPQPKMRAISSPE